MPLRMMTPHRLARINYPVRVGSFGFAFTVIVLVLMERGFSVAALVLAALSFLAYPHAAFVHTRLALDSKRAEMRNLVIDSAILGLWVAQIHFAMWPALGALIALNLNNAICGGLRQLALGLLAYLAGAALWGALWGYPLRPDVSLPVATLCFVGVAGYVSAIGVVFYQANRRLSEARETLARSERQFRFIAEQSGSLIAIIDPERRIQYRSAPHVEVFDPNRVEPGADWLELVRADERPRAAEFLQTVMHKESRDSCHLHFDGAGGKTMLMECHASFLTNEFGGETRMLLLSCRLVGAAAVAGTGGSDAGAIDAVVLSDAAGRAEYADEGYQLLTGVPVAQVIGRMCHELRSAVGTDNLFEQVTRSLARDGRWQGRCLERRSDGSVFLASVRVFGVGPDSEAITRLAWLITRVVDAGGGPVATGRQEVRGGFAATAGNAVSPRETQASAEGPAAG